MLRFPRSYLHSTRMLQRNLSQELRLYQKFPLLSHFMFEELGAVQKRKVITLFKNVPHIGKTHDTLSECVMTFVGGCCNEVNLFHIAHYGTSSESVDRDAIAASRPRSKWIIHSSAAAASGRGTVINISSASRPLRRSAPRSPLSPLCVRFFIGGTVLSLYLNLASF